MPDAQRQFFRAKSLERRSTPDRLDLLLRIVRRRNWIPLMGAGSILVLALVWCFLGRIPVTAEGTAVLVRPRQVTPIQAAAAGQLLTLEVQVGDPLKKGQVIGTLDIPGLRQQFEAEKHRLEAFLARSRRLEGFNREQARLEAAYLEERRKRIKSRIETLTALAKQVRRGSEAYKKQVENLRTTSAVVDELGEALEARLDAYAKRPDEDAASEDELFDARERWVSNRLRRAEIEVLVQELRLREIQALEQAHKQMDLVEDLRMQLEQIRLEEYQAQNRLSEALLHDETSERDIRRNIERLKSSLDTHGRILADHAGTVLEVTTSAGSTVVAGQRIASMAVDDPEERMVALAYFDVGDGKRIATGMRARVSPVTVQRERFGSMVAEVERVSAYPVTADAVLSQVGNREMAQMLVGNQSRIEVSASLVMDPESASGFEWTSSGGPDARITAGTSARITVTIEERTPITLLIPTLRGWLGLD